MAKEACGLFLTLALLAFTTLAAAAPVKRTAPAPQPTPSPTVDAGYLPIDCYKTAKQATTLTDEQALTLCRCAISERPIRCYLEAKKTTLLQENQILRLCVNTAVFPRECDDDED